MKIPFDEVIMVEDAKRGCNRARSQIYNRYHGEMLRIAKRYARTEEDAREIMMDGFFRVFRDIKNFRFSKSGGLRYWITIIMIRCGLYYQKLQSTIEATLVLEPDVGVEGDQVALITFKEIRAHVDKLPERCKKVFIAYYFQNATHSEIAQREGFSEGTSKSHLYEAREKLKEILGPLYNADHKYGKAPKKQPSAKPGDERTKHEGYDAGLQ